MENRKCEQCGKPVQEGTTYDGYPVHRECMEDFAWDENLRCLNGDA